MKLFKILPICAVGMIAISSQTWASDLTIPNSFTAGSRAVAADVNANFGAVETAVDDNNSRLAAMEALVATLQASLATTQADLVTANGNISNLQINLTAANVSIASLQTDLTTANASISSLQTDLATADSNIAALQTDSSNANSSITSLQAGQVVGLANYLTVDTTLNRVIFSGANVHVNNGLGNTATINGVGNIIVGYDEDTISLVSVCADGQLLNQTDCESAGEIWSIVHKSGSHNVVIGFWHNYSRYSGFLAGAGNNVLANNASVSGGVGNRASGYASSVSGGNSNTASGSSSSVSGGNTRTAAGTDDWAAGTLFENF